MPPPTAAEVLRTYGGSALGHESAAAVLGLDLLDQPPRRCVTLPRNNSRVSLDGWDVSRAGLGADEVELIDGQRVTAVLRTLVDLARSRPLDAAVVAADSALRQRLVSGRALRAALS